jgi:2-oxoglutarate dehydrogenase complex dehydrogenase (E1) component-like enzyme
VRVEELHPFPAELLRDVLAGYPGLSEVVWLQEEPRNMGAWSYVAPRLQEVHAEEQSRIVAEAFAGVRALEMHD